MNGHRLGQQLTFQRIVFAGGFDPTDLKFGLGSKPGRQRGCQRRRRKVQTPACLPTLWRPGTLRDQRERRARRGANVELALRKCPISPHIELKRQVRRQSERSSERPALHFFGVRVQLKPADLGHRKVGCRVVTDMKSAIGAEFSGLRAVPRKIESQTNVVEAALRAECGFQ